MGKRVVETLGCRKVNGIFTPTLLINIKVRLNGEKSKLNGEMIFNFECLMFNYGFNWDSSFNCVLLIFRAT